MEKRSFTTKQLTECWMVLGAAKYGKLSDADKIKVWRLTRQLKPIATKYMEDVKDAQEKLSPDDGFFDEMRKAQQYEVAMQRGGGDLPMNADEHKKFIDKKKTLDKLIEDALKDIADKQLEISFEPIGEETFAQLMSSNEWNLDQAIAVSEVIVDVTAPLSGR